MKINLDEFKKKLEVLDVMFSKMKSSDKRFKELKKSIYVLRKILADDRLIVSPYGPETAIVQYSIN